MPDPLLALIRDTLFYLKDPLLPKQVMATGDESLFFKIKNEAKRPEQTPHFNGPILGVKPQFSPKKEEKAPALPAAPVKHIPEQKPTSEMKALLQRIVPHMALTDQVPDDKEAKRIASAWREKIPEAEVVLIACTADAATLEFLKGLARAIEQNLAKPKILMGERLEREKRWDLFLEKNIFRLIIATSGWEAFSDLKRFYRSASGEHFLGKTPFLLLSPVENYRQLENKALLWKKLCQSLKK